MMLAVGQALALGGVGYLAYTFSEAGKDMTFGQQVAADLEARWKGHNWLLADGDSRIEFNQTMLVDPPKVGMYLADRDWGLIPADADMRQTAALNELSRVYTQINQHRALVHPGCTAVVDNVLARD